jgi:hypothetical protein
MQQLSWNCDVSHLLFLFRFRGRIGTADTVTPENLHDHSLGLISSAFPYKQERVRFDDAMKDLGSLRLLGDITLNARSQPFQQPEKISILGPEMVLQILANFLGQRRTAASRGDSDGEVPPPNNRGDDELAELRFVNYIEQDIPGPGLFGNLPVNGFIVGCTNREADTVQV